MRKLFGLARTLNFSYTSNTLVALWSFAIVLVYTVYFHLQYPDLGWQKVVLEGILAGITVFLSWAISRELEPDSTLAATLTMAICSIGLLWNGGEADLLLGAYFLLCLRIINCTTGLPPSWLELLGLALYSLVLAYKQAYLAALALPASLFISFRLNSVSGKAAPLLSLLLVTAILIVGFINFDGWSNPGELTTASTIIIAVIASAFAFYIRKKITTQAVDDYSRQPLSLKRIKAAQLFALLLIVLLSLWFGTSGIMRFLPFWAAFSGVVLSLPFSNK